MSFRRIVLIAAAVLTLSGCVAYERDVVYRDRDHYHHHDYDHDRYGWR
jgi:hypothetical protein